ncbi:hypothetical protein BU15DRAFT_82984 [Melanogaster broomeanus]|nr:hypothetical protein BU15DRAFT_82984 [Melanogaster broomeanus]
MQVLELSDEQVESQLGSMDVGDVNVYLIRAQNAAVVFRKKENHVLFEAFEVSPTTEAVMGARGKLVCSYPGPAIEIPDDAFLSELVNFLIHMNDDRITDALPVTYKAGSQVEETQKKREMEHAELGETNTASRIIPFLQDISLCGCDQVSLEAKRRDMANKISTSGHCQLYKFPPPIVIFELGLSVSFEYSVRSSHPPSVGGSLFISQPEQPYILSDDYSRASALITRQLQGPESTLASTRSHLLSALPILHLS